MPDGERPGTFAPRIVTDTTSHPFSLRPLHPAPAKTENATMRIPRLALPLVLAAALVAGCDRSPLSPGEVAGRYLLVSVNGAPLPTVTVETPDATTTVVKSTLQLNADGSGTDSRVERFTARPAGATTEKASSLAVRIRPVSGSLEFVYLCSPDGTVLCLSVGGTAERTADGLLVHIVGNDLAFRRID